MAEQHPNARYRIIPIEAEDTTASVETWSSMVVVEFIAPVLSGKLGLTCQEAQDLGLGLLAAAQCIREETP
jgi:hypothetical protein